MVILKRIFGPEFRFFVIFEILGGFLGPNLTKKSVFDPPGGPKSEKFHKDAT